MKKIFSILICLTLFTQSYADSPLTSTFFATAYADQPLIKQILDVRGMDEKYNFDLTSEMLKYFDDISITLDKKVALINALGWGDDKNTGIFKKHLSKKYGLQESDIDQILILEVNETSVLPESAKKISNDDLVLLGYLQIMGNYFEPTRGILAIEAAITNNMGSEATAWVYSLLAAQIYLDISWCEVYVSVFQVSIMTYTKDFMRDEAKNAIWEYIGLYQSSCEEVVDGEDVASEPDVFENSLEYYSANPVYKKQDLQIGDEKSTSVDLEILNSDKSNDQMLENWIFYDPDDNGTVMRIEVRNNGTMTSAETNLMFHNFPDDTDGLGEIYNQAVIPAIEPGKTIIVDVRIPQYWIYDPNANFEISLDFDGNIREINEENNRKSFYEAG